MIHGSSSAPSPTVYPRVLVLAEQPSPPETDKGQVPNAPRRRETGGGTSRKDRRVKGAEREVRVLLYSKKWVGQRAAVHTLDRRGEA